MTSDALQTTIDSLDDLLDQERAALLRGELDKLQRLYEYKVRLIDQLRVLDLENSDDLRPLSDKIDRNQSLLSSALEGIRAVTRRLDAVRQARENLETYGADGKRTSLGTRAGKALEKRA